MKARFRRTGLGVSLLCLALALFCRAPLAGRDVVIIALQPLGSVGADIVEEVRKGIEAAYLARVEALPERALPDSAWYAPNKRYRAEVLLSFLEENDGARYARVLGLTEKDISTTKGDVYDWGIFGLGSMGGPGCVVSTFRLGRGGASKEKFRFRLVKVVNHELGHTFGLPHCPVRGCLMQDARGTIVTVDGETGAFCPSCRERLGKLLRP